MFNWSLKLKKQTKFISPVGPRFESAPWKNLYISDTHIKIKVPKHRTALPTESIDTNHACNLHNLHDKLYEKNGIRLRACVLTLREWDFYGPWFTGRMGAITMSITIESPADISEGLNFFHPRALEAGITNFLTQRYSNHFSVVNSEQMWLAPMNWKIIKDLPCIGVCFNASNIDVQFNGHGPDYYLAVPISKHHFVMICCRISRATVFTDIQPEPTVDEWIDHKPFITLINQVLDSVQVTLSPEAQADQEAALQGLEDKSLVKEFPPIKWTKQSGR